MEIQITEYLNHHSILTDAQSGSRKQLSCITVLLNIIDAILRDTDQGLLTILVLFEFSRAFDYFNNDLLFTVPKYIGFCEYAKWLRSYLMNRQQNVTSDSLVSKSLALLAGVPQGSSLGPVVPFTLYSAFLTKRLVHYECHFFAHDTQVYLSFPPDALQNWCEEINIDLNKCLYLFSHLEGDMQNYDEMSAIDHFFYIIFISFFNY